MSGGRPTKYNPKYCQELIDFFDIEPYEDKDIPHYKNGEVSWSDIKRMANRLPTVRGFCKQIGIDYTTFYEWLGGKDDKGNLKHPEFSHAFTQAKDLQKWFLIENGLNGTYNPIFAKFTAVNITDMKDKSDVTSDGKSLTTFSDAQIDRLAERVLRRKGGDGSTSGEEITD